MQSEFGFRIAALDSTHYSASLCLAEHVWHVRLPDPRRRSYGTIRPLTPTDPSSGSSLAELAAQAITALRLVSETESTLDNQRRVVEAAVATEEMARLLRGAKSGRDTIFELLKAASPDEVSADFLRHASGIQEFARRIRELHVEFGYDVEASTSGYRLVSIDPDSTVAEKWALMNEIRRRDTSVIQRIEALFRSRLGEIVTTKDIEYVAKISSGPRRVREMRTEHGLRIESHKDNPNLHPGEYLLLDPESIPASERAVDARRRERILERDGHASVLCGREPDRKKRIWLEVDHIISLADGGGNDDDNLRTLCKVCHRAKRSSGGETQAAQGRCSQRPLQGPRGRHCRSGERSQSSCRTKRSRRGILAAAQLPSG